jgi:hypothetical protein
VYRKPNEPGPKGPRAQRVAQAYWLASGGPFKSSGNPLNGWADPFRKVRSKANAKALQLAQATFRTSLSQTAAKGKPPWYLGTYFPVEDPTIKAHAKNPNLSKVRVVEFRNSRKTRWSTPPPLPMKSPLTGRSHASFFSPAARASIKSSARSRRPAAMVRLPSVISEPARRTPCPGNASPET